MPTDANVLKFKFNPGSYAQFIRWLMENPKSTVQDIVEATGYGEAAVRQFLIELRRVGLVYISDYFMSPNGSRQTYAYSWGPNKNDLPAPRMSNAERSRRWRKNRRKKNAQGHTIAQAWAQGAQT